MDTSKITLGPGSEKATLDEVVKALWEHNFRASRTSPGETQNQFRKRKWEQFVDLPEAEFKALVADANTALASPDNGKRAEFLENLTQRLTGAPAGELHEPVAAATAQRQR